jgi:hypothetical protein
MDELLDKQALHELLVRYCRAVDRCDAELLASVYHPDAEEDHGLYRGGIPEFVDWVLGRQRRIQSSMHCILNEYFEVDGDVAHGESYWMWCARPARVAGRPEDDPRTLVTTGGRYIDRFERRSGEWRIARRRVVLEFDRVLHDVEPLTEGFLVGRRDRDDISYEELGGDRGA